jgi:hypothetical protein
MGCRLRPPRRRAPVRAAFRPPTARGAALAGGHRGAQHLAVNPGRGGKDRGVKPAQQQGQLVGAHPFGRDQRGGAGRPGVHQPGAKGIGPVEGAGVHQPVGFGQAIPAGMHHPAGPKRAVGMGDGARPARGARGIDQIGQPVGAAHRPVARGKVAHRGQFSDGQHRAARAAGRDTRGGNDQRGGFRRRYGSTRGAVNWLEVGTGTSPAAMAPRKASGKSTVLPSRISTRSPGRTPSRRKARRCHAPPAPAGHRTTARRRRGARTCKRHLVGQPVGGGQRMRGQIERCRTGGPGGRVEKGQHRRPLAGVHPGLAGRGAGCKGGAAQPRPGPDPGPLVCAFEAAPAQGRGGCAPAASCKGVPSAMRA